MNENKQNNFWQTIVAGASIAVIAGFGFLIFSMSVQIETNTNSINDLKTDMYQFRSTTHQV